MVGLTPEQIRDARTGSAVEGKSNAILRFATQLVEERGFVSDDAISSARDAGVNDAELAEIIANTAYNLFSNYFNHVAEPKIDFPAVKPLEVATTADSCSTGTCAS